MKPPAKLTPLKLSRDEQEQLERWALRRAACASLALRARIVLGCEAGSSNREAECAEDAPRAAGLLIELLTIAGEARKPGEGDIRFNPDGSSTGGRISLIDGQRKVAVGVDWLTGRVSVADVR